MKKNILGMLIAASCLSFNVSAEDNIKFTISSGSTFNTHGEYIRKATCFTGRLIKSEKVSQGAYSHLLCNNLKIEDVIFNKSSVKSTIFIKGELDVIVRHIGLNFTDDQLISGKLLASGILTQSNNSMSDFEMTIGNETIQAVTNSYFVYPEIYPGDDYLRKYSRNQEFNTYSILKGTRLSDSQNVQIRVYGDSSFGGNHNGLDTTYDEPQALDFQSRKYSISGRCVLNKQDGVSPITILNDDSFLKDGVDADCTLDESYKNILTFMVDTLEKSILIDSKFTIKPTSNADILVSFKTKDKYHWKWGVRAVPKGPHYEGIDSDVSQPLFNMCPAGSEINFYGYSNKDFLEPLLCKYMVENPRKL
jgi:hypothetical protein